MGAQILLGVMKIFKFDLVMVAQLCEYTKKHRIVHFQWVNCMVFI